MRTCHAALFLLSFAWASATAAEAAEIPEVHNPESPPRERTIQYDEVWRAGNDENAEYLFGVIQRVDEDEDGNLYLLDTQLQEVHGFDAQGNWLGRIARRGEGPGELEMVYRIVALGDGQLGLLKVMPSRLIRITTGGVPLGDIDFEPAAPEEQVQWASMSRVEAGGGVLYGQGQFRLDGAFPGESLQFVASFGQDGKELHRFSESRGGYDFSRPIVVDELQRHDPYFQWTADGTGSTSSTADGSCG